MRKIVEKVFMVPCYHKTIMKFMYGLAFVTIVGVAILAIIATS